MTYFVFVDESGTLPDPSERYFVVAAVGTHDPRTLANIVKKIRHWLKQRGKRFQNIVELRFYSTGRETRIKLLELLGTSDDIQIHLLVVEKDDAFIGGTPKNYATVVWALLGRIVAESPQAQIVLDKQFSKPSQRAALKQAIVSHAKSDLSIRHGDSQTEVCLQIADFIAGSGMAKYLREEDEYLEIVREKIVSERLMFWSEIEKW